MVSRMIGNFKNTTQFGKFFGTQITPQKLKFFGGMFALFFWTYEPWYNIFLSQQSASADLLDAETTSWKNYSCLQFLSRLCIWREYNLSCSGSMHLGSYFSNFFQKYVRY